MIQTISAQLTSEKDVSFELKKLQEIFDSIQKQNKIPLNQEVDGSLLIQLSLIKIKDKYNYDLENYYAQNEAFLKKNIGLNYTIDALQNINPSQIDVEDNILYQRRFLNGLEWNILKGGYVDSRNQLKSLQIERELELELAKLNYSRKNIPLKMNQCILWFNSQKNDLLQMRYNLLQKQLFSIEKLYFAKKLSKDFVLSTQTKMAEIQAMKAIYAAYNDEIQVFIEDSLFNYSAPLFDLNYKNLTIQQEISTNLDSLTNSLLNQIETQNKWYYDVRLKTYLRHSYYDLLSQSPNSRSFFSAGIGATIPLRFNHKEQAEIDKEKIFRKVQSIAEVSDNKQIEILNEAYEYRYQLKQYVIFHQKRILLNESLRQERVKGKLLDADFNPLHGLDLIDQLLQVEIELLDLKQNLYIKLLKLQEKIPTKKMEELIVPMELPNYFDFEEKTGRNCYIWSKSFNEKEIDFIAEYLIYNQFDEIQLAINSNDPFLKEKTELIKILFSKNIKVDLMLGQNSLLDSENYKKEVDAMISQFPLEKVNGIHLDIEPHTRAEWKQNQEVLKNKYKNIVHETKSLCKSYNLKLSIDLPLTLDTNYVKELLKEVNTIRFMCYENIKTEYIERKLKPFLNEKDKLSIALRTEDFKTRNEMESFAKSLCQITGISTLNFHDLNRLLELDKKSLTNSNEEH